jgi:uncharacterized protein
MFHRASSSLTLATVALALSLAPAAAQMPGCTGVNMMDEFKTSAPDVHAQIRKTADATVNGRHVLYQIELPDSPERGVSYLFGTIQLTDDRVQKLSPAAADAFNKVRRVAVEVANVDVERQGEGLNTLHQMGRLVLPSSGKLDALLTPAEAQMTVKALARVKLSADLIPRVRPWAATLMLSTTDCERSRKSAGRATMDGELARRAEARGIGTFDIETVETQYTSMSDIPHDDQVALLKAQLTHSGRMNDVAETMLQFYLARDFAAMWPFQMALGKQAGVDAKSYAEAETHLIVERNKRMHNRLHMHLQRGGVFVAVNAMHLPGTHGLVALLSDGGFKLTPIE